MVFFAVLSLLLLFVDARYRYLEATRSVLSLLVSPIQRLATMPGALLNEAGVFITAQSNLINDNQSLHKQHDNDAAQLLRLQSLQMENLQLRNLLALQQHGELTVQAAEIMYSERDVFKRMLLIDKGINAGVKAGQVVLDDAGIIGQITRVYPFLSEVTLITEKNHTVPVQVLRNGLRTILFGSGDTTQLSLRYMPVSSDIQNDDILVTSGIDGVYPHGLPVARVVKIERDAAYPFARITCLPVAGVDKHRHLLIMSSPPKPPELPVEQNATVQHSKNRQKK